MKRISSGVKGIDRMAQGGFPEGSVIGLSGPAGVGKTIIALHYVFAGASAGEKSVYINLDEPRENIDRVIGSMHFAKEFSELEKSKKIKILCISYEEFTDAYCDLFKQIETDRKIRRLVIDSFNGFFNYVILDKQLDSGTGNPEVRKLIRRAFSMLRREGLTSLLVLEEDKAIRNELSAILGFMVDGMVSLDFLSLGTVDRRIFIPKMRWTKQYDSSLPFEISGKGITVKMEEE